MYKVESNLITHLQAHNPKYALLSERYFVFMSSHLNTIGFLGVIS